MQQRIRVAVVDDERDMRESIGQWLTLSGFEVETHDSASEALRSIGTDWPGVVVTDVKMPGMDGMAFLRKLMGFDRTLPVILITGHGDVSMAVEAMRLGAYDFLEKPFNPDRLTDLVRRACEARRLTLDNRQLRRELGDAAALGRRLVGGSKAMERLREEILDLGQADGHVLIEGETGTGKTLVAHALHAVGPRAGRPFVTVSCAAHAEGGLMKRLFGPSDEGERLPAVEEARGGTLLLEDVETLPDSVQARLLTFLDAQGSPPETRVIGVSNAATEEEEARHRLRPELYFRLASGRILLPPLRERGEDILTLFTHFAERFAEDYGCNAPVLTAEDAAALFRSPWPGNVRQLLNLAERAVLQARRGEGSIASLISGPGSGSDAMPAAGVRPGKPLKEYVEAFERMLIDNAMRRHRGSVQKVMEELSIPRRTLNEKMAKYGLSRANYL